MSEVVVDRYQEVWTVTHRGRGTDSFGVRDKAVAAAIDWAGRLHRDGDGGVVVVVREQDGSFSRVWTPEAAAS